MTRPLILFAALLGVGLPALAQDGQQLFKDGDKRHRLPTERTKSTMTLQEAGGTARVMELETLVQTNDTEGDRARIRFDGPADVKGTALLSVEAKKDATVDQWLYLPAFRKTRRIGTSELGDRFVNSDVFYEDLRRRPPEDYACKYLRAEKCGEGDCHVVECVPEKPAFAKECPYGKIQFWQRKDTLYPVRIRYFDRDGKAAKELEASKLVKVAGGAWRADTVTMLDVKRKHRTVLQVTERQVNLKLPADAFSQHSLGEP